MKFFNTRWRNSRVGHDPRTIAAELTGLENVTGVGKRVERRLRAGDTDFAVDLGIALWQRYGQDPAPPWQYRSTSHNVLRQLALTPGLLEPALRLIAATRS